VSRIQPALDRLCADVEALSGDLGLAVRPQDLGVLDRTGHLALGAPGQRISPNGACRLLRAADGWVALNLARPEDRGLVPAWLLTDFPDSEDEDGVWALAEAATLQHRCADLVVQATLLGLPVSRVGEAEPKPAPFGLFGRGRSRSGPIRAIDLSALWAGPLCGAILAAMGAGVTRIESQRRPDPTRETTPAFYEALNGAKVHQALDLALPEDQSRLRAAVADADVLITSARPRALPSLGLEPDRMFSANPGLVWVAITGHGGDGDSARRVAFGDDAAAAGGLVDWTGAGPVFLGDALADPVAGLEAAREALSALCDGRGGRLDVAMAGAAARAAAVCGLGSAA
jgi:hypothetical protein